MFSRVWGLGLIGIGFETATPEHRSFDHGMWSSDTRKSFVMVCSVVDDPKLETLKPYTLTPMPLDFTQNPKP